MVGRWACILLAALLAVPVPAAADWLMVGGDPQQTGHASGAAPAWGDVALRVEIPELGNASVPYASSPIVVSGSVYLAMYRTSVTTGTTARIILARVELDTGAIKIAAEFPSGGSATSVAAHTPQLASDGQLLYILDGSLIRTYDPATGTLGEPLEFAVPGVAGSAQADSSGLCCLESSRMVAAGGRLYVALSREGGTLGMPRLYVVDPANRTARGPWFLVPQAPDPPGSGVPAMPVPAYVSDQATTTLEVEGLAVIDAVAVVTLGTVDRENGAGDVSVTPASGPMNSVFLAVDTTRSPPETKWVTSDGLVATDPNGLIVPRTAPSVVAGGKLFTKSEYLTTYDLATGKLLANNGFGYVGDEGGGMAYARDRLFAGIGNRVVALDDNLQPIWTATLPQEGLRIQHEGLVVAGDTVMALAHSGGFAASVLFAFDRATGKPIWNHPLPARVRYLAADDGLAILADDTGFLNVIGTLPLSLQPVAAFSSFYPDVGQSITVDLNMTLPSALGDATVFHVEWGDGMSEDWGPAATFSHAYRVPGDATARLYVGNAAGQTSSVPVTVHVGQHDPAVTIFNSPFASEYQNTTFFVIGLLATGAAALFGIIRAGRKRRRLHRELRDLEADYDRLQADAVACDAMLAQRKARARSLFLERKLEEAHSSFLTGRIDELRRNLRLGTVDARLKFLPHGMVLQLQRLLADGRIDGYERDHFVAALEQERSLTARQRAEVARVVDSWFARDAGQKG